MTAIWHGFLIFIFLNVTVVFGTGLFAMDRGVAALQAISHRF
jgi:hypothetical protein